MVVIKEHGSPQDYVAYYRAQAGAGLAGFRGTPVMYGTGLGGLFRGLFRKAMPLLRKGLEIVKPHVKSAAKNIVRDMAGQLVSRVVGGGQEGAGLVVARKNYALGPPTPSKKRKNVRKRHHTKRKRAQKRKRCDSRDIF